MLLSPDMRGCECEKRKLRTDDGGGMGGDLGAGGSTSQTAAGTFSRSAGRCKARVRGRN